MRSIERLPEATHSSVRSGVVISDLTRIVEELVFNSLDAGATEVSVSVGLGSSYLKVVDNGSGILRDGLELLGERYVTSRVDNLALVDTGTEYYDFHGEALCSISDVSLLEIVTKARGKPNGYRKILKKRKCLFLGINDDRQDVGTTVIVHDIFYNQPVRRKHMQSSPKKVLDSIKMSVLKIALVHFNVTFKVVDVESLVELLHTGLSSSPLPLLSSHFGIDNSASFHKLILSDGELKLSGYISDPREIFSLKAIQYVCIHVYVDINSRFIYKGPIHKLVNQLAAKFDLSSSWQLATGSQSEKQNKHDMCPAFILNLQCPRSYYDIFTFERSRTSLEFKDWAPILTFIENGVMHLWTKNTPHDTLETGKKRCRKQNSQTPLDLGSPQLKKLCKNHDSMETFEECVFSSRKPFREVSKFKKHQIKAALLSETDYLSQVCDGFHAGYMGIREKEMKNHLSPFSVSSPVQVACTYGRKEDGLSSSALKNILPAYDEKIDALPLVSGVSGDCLDFGDDIHINQGQSKSFLRSCSFERSLLHERKPSARDERFEFGSDDIEIKTRWIDCCDRMEDEIDLATCGPDLQSDATPPFQYSPTTQYDTHGILELPLRDSIESSLQPRNVIPDSTEVWESTSCWQSFRSGRSPLIAKETIGGKSFEDDDDAIYRNSVEGCFEFGKDTVHGYSAQQGVRDIKCSPQNTKYSWLRQSCSFMNFSPDYKREIDEFRRGDFEDMFSPNPLRRFTEAAWSPSPLCGEESPKYYSVASLYDTSPVEHEYGRRDSRIQVTSLNRKEPSLRSHSAPPSYKGKKRYLDLAYSSTMFSAKDDLQNIILELSSTEPSHSSQGQLHADMNLKCSHKTFSQYHLSRMERPIMDCSVAERSGLIITPEIIGIQNGEQEQNEQLINMDSFECPDLKEHQDSLDSGWKWRNCSLPTAIESGFGIKFNQDATILDISSDILHLGGDSLVPKSIERGCLEGAQVLNQVDKKFIAVVAGKTLAIIDQHAADERIRVEELRHKVLSGEMKTIKYLNAEHELVLPEVGYQLLHNYADQIQTWGWICNIHSQDMNSFSKHLDFLHRQPTVVKLLAVPCILGVNLNDIDLLEFLQQLADTDGSSTVPPSVHRILNNKACRGAIMFGDTLLPSECSLIVEELKRTSLCFQCAHGRPTTVPLVKLDVLHNKIARLGSDESWHGLRQHKLSLKRTSQRLSHALS